MARNNLKVVDPAEMTREALHEAIAKRQVVKDEIDAVTRARTHARDEWLKADAALETLRNPENERSETLGEHLSEEIASGKNPDAGALESDRVRMAATERELANAVDIWKRAKDECDAKIRDAERRLVYLELSVDSKVAAVLAASGSVEKLMHGLAEMQAEVARRRAAIHWIIENAGYKPDERQCMLSQQARLFRVDLERHPGAAEWSAAREALKRDADAVLPV